VRGRASPITGTLVVADLVVRDGASFDQVRHEVLSACRAALPPHKVPAMLRPRLPRPARRRPARDPVHARSQFGVAQPLVALDQRRPIPKPRRQIGQQPRQDQRRIAQQIEQRLFPPIRLAALQSPA